MKILVTGGAGYVGSVLVPELLRLGHLVTILDNFMYNQTPLLDYCYSSNLEIIRGDASEWVELTKGKEFDIIIPLACITGAPACDFNPELAMQVNFDNIHHLAMYSKAAFGKNIKIIYPNTNSGYGIGNEGMCTEESPLRPISGYGIFKRQSEKVVLDAGNSIVLRLATAFGVSPRMRLDLLVNDFVYRAVYDRFLVLFEAHFRRNFCHVHDIASAFIHCIDNWDTMKNQVYNVGDTKANMTKLELAQKIKEHIPELNITEAEVGQDPDKRDYIVSNEKLEKTGWKPIMTIDDGIKELIKAYRIIKRNQYANI